MDSGFYPMPDSSVNSLIPENASASPIAVSRSQSHGFNPAQAHTA
jgi:hypothetical protein